MKYVLISSNLSSSAITIHYEFLALSTLPLNHAGAMFFVLFIKWRVGVASHLEGLERRRKKFG
jgi:hypothetical protein